MGCSTNKRHSQKGLKQIELLVYYTFFMPFSLFFFCWLNLTFTLILLQEHSYIYAPKIHAFTVRTLYLPVSLFSFSNTHLTEQQRYMAAYVLVV